jgi:alanyl-tRNA synthetase
MFIRICTCTRTNIPLGFEVAMAEAKERSRAGGKKAAGASLKFEAEATGWLQKHSVPLTVC